MATLTVWKFADPGGAAAAMDTLRELEKDGLIDVYDGAVVSWEVGASKPKTTQLYSSARSGALGGAFWGGLFGLIFFVPLLGVAIGAATGAAAGSLTDAGIDDEFIKKTRREVTPGTSALFALTGFAVIEKVHAAFGAHHGELMSTNLTEEQEQTLREAFSDT
jgi:uncharacterized membrane protein